jgi:hypothetical protein
MLNSFTKSPNLGLPQCYIIVFSEIPRQKGCCLLVTGDGVTVLYETRVGECRCIENIVTRAPVFATRYQISV